MTEPTSAERPLSVIIYEGFGFVACSPPALEYKSDKCRGKASYVCHHCGSPLCEECVVKKPDSAFPTFERFAKSRQPFIDIATKVLAALLIFPIISFTKTFLTTQNVPIEFTLPHFNFGILNILLKFDEITIYADLVSIISLSLIVSAISIIFITNMKIEETPEGKKKLTIYKRYNLLAAHCKLCAEKHHKKKYLFKIIVAAISIIALLNIYTQYQSNFMDLTFPIGLLVFARMVQKIEKPMLDVVIPPF